MYVMKLVTYYYRFVNPSIDRIREPCAWTV